MASRSISEGPVILGTETPVPRPPKNVVVSKKQIGDRVRALRQARDMSQGDLATLLEIPPTNVSAIERGVRGLSLQQLVKLASALEVAPGEILNGTHPARTRGTAAPLPGSL